MRFLLWPAALLFSVLPLASACGGDDAKPTAPAGPTVSDEEYLKAICSGTRNFSNALMSKTKPEEIATVIKDFSASMKQLSPPSDLQKFQTDFVKYLDDSLSDPTSLVTRKPPAPPAAVRDRLVAAEARVPECKDGTFFDAQAAAAGTPGSAGTK
jgi:hypothetical protein